jgi:hypothetical protein
VFAVAWPGGEEPGAAIVESELVAAIVEPEALHLAMAWLVPARERMMAEAAGPRLRPQVPPVVAIVTRHLRAVAQDDAEAERGPRIPVRHIRPVRLGRRFADREGAKGGREQKVPTHGCLPTNFRKRASSLHHVV